MIQQESSKRPAFPLILTGNDLLGGHVVYFDGAGWSLRPSEAHVAVDAAGAEAFDAAIAASANQVVDPYMVTVALGPGGEPVPAHVRERIRASAADHRPRGGPPDVPL